MIGIINMRGQVEDKKEQKLLKEVFNDFKASIDKSEVTILNNNKKTKTGLKTPNKRIFDTGAQRDDNSGKIRPDLISPLMLKALGKVMAEGANHYGERNWEKGIPDEVFKESASRHYLQWMNNETDEDHAAKLIFNVMGWIHNRDKQ